MKLATSNAVRTEIVNRLFNFMQEAGEDVAMITSNSFNFPVVMDDEEGFVEVVAKVVKKDSDECYQEREDYVMKLREKAVKAAEREKASAEKKAKAEAKKKEKEKKEAKEEEE